MLNCKKLCFIILVAIFFISNVSMSYASSVNQEATGILTTFTASQVKVGTLSCPITASTEYEDSNSLPISRTRFAVGDQVRLRCRDGEAKNLKLLGGSSSSSSSNSSSNSSSSSSSNSSSSSRSSSNSSSSSSSADVKDRNLKDSLNVVDGISSSVTSVIRFQSSNRGKEQKLTASVKIPVPNSIPLTATIEDANNLELFLTLFRRGTAYAQCILKYSKSLTTSAEHKLDVRKENSKVRSRKGFCDMNLSRDGIQKGVPSVRKGDTTTLEEISSGVFMEGVL